MRARVCVCVFEFDVFFYGRNLFDLRLVLCSLFRRQTDKQIDRETETDRERQKQIERGEH